MIYAKKAEIYKKVLVALCANPEMIRILDNAKKDEGTISHNLSMMALYITNEAMNVLDE